MNRGAMLTSFRKDNGSVRNQLKSIGMNQQVAISDK
jgi:hypothetical protein